MKARVLIKKERTIEVDGRERVVSEFEKFYVDPSHDFHTKHGRIPKAELAKEAGSRIALGKEEFTVLDADFIDDYKRIKRLAQIISLKDIGCIIAYAGINRKSRVLEAGVGSGAVSCFLAGIVKEVVSFDKDERSLEVARENVRNLGISNVQVLEGDIYNADVLGSVELGFDVFLLDVPDPKLALETASKALKMGGFLVVYVPNISQVQDFVKALPASFLLEDTLEVIEREWAVDAKRSRPATKDYGHTGFLTFARKIG